MPRPKTTPRRLRPWFGDPGLRPPLWFQKSAAGVVGGIDSALVAVVAAEALGPNVLGVGITVQVLLEGSKTDAAELARLLGLNTEKSPSNPCSRTRPWPRCSTGGPWTWLKTFKRASGRC